WRMDIDGGNPRQLTSGNDDDFPQCSPDGRWVVYRTWSFGKPMVVRVPIDGGNPVVLSEKWMGRPAISPDGKFGAGTCLDDEQPTAPMKMAIVSFERGEIIKAFDHRSMDEGFRWTRDGRAVMYTVTRNGVSNVWSQPVDGGAAKQLTDFNSDRIFWFD